jgi:hypothetical protein
MAETIKTEVITTVVVTDIIPGDPLALVTVKRAINSQGIARHITQKTLVRDPNLARRLFAEVRRGDEVTLTLTTAWTAESYETEISDFVFPLRLEDSPREKVLAPQKAA